MMDEKKILIMNLSKGLIGETNANLLGSMLTTRIYLAAMSRADLPVEVMKRMPNFYFYVDEFQSFANSTFANILSEARKYHLNLIIAHQYVDQMEEDVRSAVFGNVGTTIAFRVGPFDAEVLETVFAPQFTAIDLVNLGFAQIYLSLMIDGVGSQPFSAQTLPPLSKPSVSYRGMVIDSSRKNYARTRMEVEKIVMDLHTPTAPAEKPAPKKVAVKPGMNGTGSNGNGRPPAAAGNNSNAAAAAARVAAKPQSKPVDPQKKAEEMRAILGKIRNANGSGNGSNANGNQSAASKKEVTADDSPHRSELKNLLASLVPPAPKQEPQATATESAPSAPLPTERPMEAAAPKDPPPRPVPVTPPESAVVEEPVRQAPEPLTHESRQADNGIDPTVVKRMLRNHHDERSPFQ